MTRLRGQARLLTAILIGLSLTAACGKAAAPPASQDAPSTASASSSAAAKPAILNIAEPADPQTLNSMIAQDEYSFNVLNQVFEGLTRCDATGTPQPGIAQSWDVSDGGTTYTFHLRNAQWSNGDPLTAGDFVYAWQQVLDPRNGAPYSYQLQYVQGAQALLGFPKPPDPQKQAAQYQQYMQTEGPKIDQLLAAVGVSAPDAHTLVVHLTKPVAYWLSLTAFPTYFPADAKQVQAWGFDKYGTDVQHLVFDGPFVLTAWVPKDHLDFQKNPTYWDAASVHLAGIHELTVGDASTLQNLYDTGKIDAMIPSVPSAVVDQYASRPGFQSFAEASVVYVEYNAQDAVFKNALIRKALSEALPRDQFASGVVKGNAMPAYAFTPPSIHDGTGQTFGALVGKVLSTTADAAQAKTDFAAGLQQLGLSKTPTITLLTSTSATSETEGTALQALWQQNLGIAVQVKNVDFSTLVTDMGQGAFQMALTGWGADYDDPETFLDLFATGNAQNFGKWSDKAYDGDMAAAQSATDASQRAQDLAAAEKELLAQLPAAPLYWPARNWIARQGVSGIVFAPTGPDYSLKDVTIQQ